MFLVIFAISFILFIIVPMKIYAIIYTDTDHKAEGAPSVLAIASLGITKRNLEYFDMPSQLRLKSTYAHSFHGTQSPSY